LFVAFSLLLHVSNVRSPIGCSPTFFRFIQLSQLSGLRYEAIISPKTLINRVHCWQATCSDAHVLEANNILLKFKRK